MNNLIKRFNSAQHSFVPEKSLITHLISYVVEVSTAVDSGNFIAAAYFDVAKAFDLVHHSRLIKNYSKHGLDQDSVIFFHLIFLTGINGYVPISKTVPISSGVPQCSILGPFLVFLQIDDTSNCIDCPIYLYADHTKLATQNSDKYVFHKLPCFRSGQPKINQQYNSH